MYRLYLAEPWKTRIEAWLQMGFANGVPTHPTTKPGGKGGWAVAVGGASQLRFKAYASELVALKPDVILAHTTPAVAALRQETTTIPIVFVQVTDPVSQGFVSNLARPGGKSVASRGLQGVLALDVPE